MLELRHEPTTAYRARLALSKGSGGTFGSYKRQEGEKSLGFSTDVGKFL